VIAAAGIALFWAGLWSWFQLDDFVWLWVARVSSQRGWWATLGTATRQGTWRPLSDPLFFTAFFRWFGLNAFPYRLTAFATYVADVFLVGTLAQRFGAARAEALLAAALFAFNPALVMPMSWTCSYNQLATVGLLCLELMLWRRYCAEGGGRRYATLVALHSLSLLILESNLMFPAIAGVYVLWFAERRLLWRVLPLAAVAALWAIVHVRHAPPIGAYQPHLSGMAQALWRYWSWTVLPPLRWDDQPWRWMIPALAAACVLVWAPYDRRAQFFAAVYLLLLAPSLTLSGHLTDYQLVAPLVGFAPLAAALYGRLAMGRLWRRGLAVALVAGQLLVGAWAARFGCRWWSGHQASIEPVIRKLLATRRQDPESSLRLVDVSDDFLQFAAGNDVFNAVGLERTCLELPPNRPPPLTPSLVCGPPNQTERRVSARQ
jgi:hypothetical protein